MKNNWLHKLTPADVVLMLGQFAMSCPKAGFFASGVIGADGRGRMSLRPDLIVFTNRGARYGVVHGGYSDISRFLWPSSPEQDFQQEFGSFQAEHGSFDAIISGHCGMAFQRSIGTKSWINACAIGMPPHYGRPQTRYVVLGEDGARIKRLDHDVAAAGDQMRKVGLVQGYEVALKTGYCRLMISCRRPCGLKHRCLILVQADDVSEQAHAGVRPEHGCKFRSSTDPRARVTSELIADRPHLPTNAWQTHGATDVVLRGQG